MSRWRIHPSEDAVIWDLSPEERHTDDYEMAGYRCDFQVRYGMTENGFLLEHRVLFPTLRLRPNNTDGSYKQVIPYDAWPWPAVNGIPVRECLRRVKLNGVLELESVSEDGNLFLLRRCYPADDARAAYEWTRVMNAGAESLDLSLTADSGGIDQTMGPMGISVCELHMLPQIGTVTLAPGESLSWAVCVTGRVAGETAPVGCAEEEYRRRLIRIERLTSPLRLDTGNRELDLMFRMAKLRAGESVFATKFGLIHSPGGKNYFAATWCNDQVEYSGPYFAYTGDPVLLEAAMNAYRMYMPFMSSQYKPIPSSVIAEGLDYWNGAGDRGDAAMYLYGASRFALAAGDPAFAEELWPAIRWCAEYCERKKTPEGVIASDSDELEDRFPSGEANLCTNTLCCAGLLAAAEIADRFGQGGEVYRERAAALRDAIERVFGHTIHGIPAYRYYDGCEVMRSWICMPLCVGIYDRAQATVDALTSEYLMRPDGFLTAEGDETVWDRSTLYSLRGIFASGHTGKAWELLQRYVRNRLLGERVPYAVEAYPEGGRRHLSGESALFCKVILEGMLDMTPAGLHAFTIKPSLPEGLDHLYLTEIHAYGTVFSVLVEHAGFRVVRFDGALLAEGRPGGTARVEV